MTSEFHLLTPPCECTLSVLVVGAGLCGLSAAISIALEGHKVVVLEAVSQLAEVGAGLQITPNAARLFGKWSILEKFSSSAADPQTLTVHRYSDGDILAHEDDFGKHMVEKYKAPFWDLHRGDVQRILHERAVELGVVFRLGQKVKTVDFDARNVTTEDGTTSESFDLIIGADGLWSRCRECFLGAQDPAKPTGDLAYRIVLNTDDITDPELKAFLAKPAVHFWIGPDAHVVSYAMRGGKLYNIVLLVPDDLPENISKGAGSVEEMHKLFTNWDPLLQKFLHGVTSVDKWKLMHREELPSWSNKEGTFALMGDSCHPMLPYLAQGANSSLEDGAVLGSILGRVTSKSQLPTAIRLYERLRKSRGEAIVRETFKQRRDFHMRDGPEQEARDAKFRATLGTELKEAFPSRWTCPVVQPWLYGYDAYKEVKDVFDKEPGLLSKL